jgi:hypothetical protein
MITTQDPNDIVVLKTESGREIEFLQYGTLYQLFNSKNVASGCFTRLEDAQGAMKRGWTMEALTDCREVKCFWSHMRLVIREFTYKEAQNVDRSMFHPHRDLERADEHVAP